MVAKLKPAQYAGRLEKKSFKTRVKVCFCVFKRRSIFYFKVLKIYPSLILDASSRALKHTNRINSAFK